MQYAITPQQMRQTEQEAFSRGMSSLLLMETAARRAYAALREMLPPGGRAVFLCGPGNNGGDGLAMARMLHLDGGRARVILPRPPETPDAKTNLACLEALWVPVGSEEAALDGADVIVDALFGTGFRGAVGEDSPLGRLIARANGAGCPILAVDIPSGMDGASGAVRGACVRAARTVTFHQPKLGLLLTPRRDWVGDLITADIGLPETPGIPWAGEGDLAALLPPRAAGAHKGDCGRVLIYAGSEGMAGAAAMAALACLRAGSGLVTVACPRAVMPILQKTVPGAMCRAAEEAPRVRCDVRLLGCGLAETEDTWQALLRLHDETALEVWDAGALNLLARHPVTLGPRAVITPHAGEAARLLGVDIADILADPLDAARGLCRKYGCGVALKSAVSVLCAPDGQLALNAVTAPALAKGGSGDALAGILASLLGQGLTIWNAMRAACLWHGLAGKLAGEQYGVRSALTGEVIDCLGPAERQARKSETENK